MNRFILVLAISVLSSGIYAQCNPDAYALACVPKLADGFNFLKSYKIDGQGGQKGKIEYSYLFTKGTQYMINLCVEGTDTDGIVVNLFDGARNKIASNLINGTYVNQLTMMCNATGIYYIQYTFNGSRRFCGGSALGFKK
ncbi:MAG: hypothetical protein ACO3FI_04035 [Cyclobacteriaceae bacterium]